MAASDQIAAQPGTSQPQLRRNLSVWEAIGISLALMAPSMAASINPQGTATTVGRATPLAFALAFVGVLLVAYTFVRLTQRFHHSGSVYGFVGATLGPSTGVVSGWALTGTYTFYSVVTTMAGGRLASSLLDSLGIWHDPPVWSGFLLGMIGLVVVWLLAISPARDGTRVLLAAEAITVLLIIIVLAVVFGKLAGHSGPGHLGLTGQIFTLPQGTGITTVFLGVVFGFLSFAGFEAAATLGEETRQPRRDIPRAILGVAIFGGIYFFLVTAVEVMGFGTTGADVTKFINSESLVGDLGSAYVAGWIGDLITAGAMVSAFSCALACVVGAGRLSFSMGRDGVLPAGLGRVSGRMRTPFAASTAVTLAAYVIIAFTWAALRGDPFTLFVQSGTIGTLILLVVYVLATIGMVKLVFFGTPPPGAARVRKWEVVIPAVGIVVLIYTLYRNVWPLPSGVAWWGPAAAIGWLVVGIILVAVRREATRRAGAQLLRAEGLTSAAATPQPAEG